MAWGQEAQIAFVSYQRSRFRNRPTLLVQQMPPRLAGCVCFSAYIHLARSLCYMPVRRPLLNSVAVSAHLSRSLFIPEPWIIVVTVDSQFTSSTAVGSNARGQSRQKRPSQNDSERLTESAQAVS